MECRDSSQKFCLGPQKPPESLSSGPHSSLVSLCDAPGATLAMETQSEPVTRRKAQGSTPTLHVGQTDEQMTLVPRYTRKSKQK